MKKRYQTLIMICLAVLIPAGVTIFAGEQATRYLYTQEKRQVSLAAVKEDIAALSSCLKPNYRCKGVNPAFNIPSGDITKIVPSTQEKK